MHRWLGLLTGIAVIALLGCSREYYARRAAIREQRIVQQQSRMIAAHQDLCGNPQRAFERGHNAGLARQPMSTAWLAECAPAEQQQQTAAYMQGYQQGAANAPTQVVVAGGGGYIGYNAGIAPCRFSSDCGPSMTCRPWGTAGSVCMGGGVSGSPCWFGNDCLSGMCNGAARVCN